MKNSLIYFGRKSSVFDFFISISPDASYNNIDFAYCEVKECMDHYRAPPESLILFKKKGEKEYLIKTASLSEDNIREILIRKFAESIEFTSKIGLDIFNEKNPGLILYRSSKTGEGKRLEVLFMEIAQILKGKIIITVSDLETHTELTFGDMAGVYPDEMPTVRLFDTRETLIKYKLEGDITKGRILEFYKNFTEDKLVKYYRSQQAPVNETGKVKKLVGSTFLQNVADEEKDVLVWYHGHNQEINTNILSVLEDIDKTMKKYQNDHILIAMIDGPNNEFPKFAAPKYPYIRLFAIGYKEDPVDFKEEKVTYDGILDFLIQNTGKRVKVNRKKDL